MIRKTLLILFVITNLIGLFLNNDYLLIPIPFIAIILGFIQFKNDKKELKAANIYCKVKNEISDQANVFKSWWFRALFGLVVGTTLYILSQNRGLTDFSVGFIITLYTVILSDSLGKKYHKFIDSIRAFENGIKLPGRDSNLIPWGKIVAIEKVRLEVSITLKNEAKSWLIKSADETDMQLIIADWERLGNNYFKQ